MTERDDNPWAWSDDKGAVVTGRGSFRSPVVAANEGEKRAKKRDIPPRYAKHVKESTPRTPRPFSTPQLFIAKPCREGFCEYCTTPSCQCGCAHLGRKIR